MELNSYTEGFKGIANELFAMFFVEKIDKIQQSVCFQMPNYLV